jgi:hypothetical protein
LGIVSFLAVGLLSVLGSILLVNLDLITALWAGILTMIVFFVSDWLHQYGHALAAKWVGQPMIGVHFFSVLSASLYPPDEPVLLPNLHIRRALGGFWVNLLIGALLGAAANSLWATGSGLGWVTAVGAIWNFLVLGLGALLPIDIPGVFTNDGGTIFHYWRQSKVKSAK